MLDDDGYQYARAAVGDNSLCSALLDHANRTLDEVLRLDLHASKPFFGEIRGPLHRRDLKLAITPPVAAVLCALARSQRSLLEAAVGPEAVLCECSVLSSDPGAAAQPVHCDTSFQGAADPTAPIARLVTVFVALQDIDAAMGPTLLFPRTHTQEAHHQLWLQPKSECPPLLRDHPRELAVLAAGDALVMDSRLWHQGGANHSDRRRSLFVLSFLSGHGGRPRGSTYSLLTGIQPPSLSDLWRDGAPSMGPGTPVASQLEQSAPADVVLHLPLRVAAPLLSLAERGLPDDPIAQQCLLQLGLAVRAQVRDDEDVHLSQAPVQVSRVLLEHLFAFRLLGPHLRASSQWGSMQAAVDEVMADG